MAEPELIELRSEPLVVTVNASGVRFTPNELRALKAETGRTMTELLGPDADDGDRMQTLAWLKLRRDGRAIAWDACGDVEIEASGEAEQPDPLNGKPSQSLPRSVGSGA